MPLVFFALATLATLATLCVSGKTSMRGVAHQCHAPHHHNTRHSPPTVLHQEFECLACDHDRTRALNADGASRDVDIGARQAERLEVQAFQGTDGVRRSAASVLRSGSLDSVAYSGKHTTSFSLPSGLETLNILCTSSRHSSHLSLEFLSSIV